MKAKLRKLQREKEKSMKSKNTEESGKSLQLSNLSNSNNTNSITESIISINQQNLNINPTKKKINKIFHKSNSITELHNNKIGSPIITNISICKERRKNTSGPISQLMEKKTKNIKRKRSRNSLSHYLEIPNDDAIKDGLLKKELLNSEGSSNLEEEINKLSMIFNLNIDNEKMLLEENTEFFDMKKTILDLEKKIEESKKEYEYIINQNTIRTINENTQIQKLEEILKKKIDENIENIRNDNNIVIQDVNILDKKLKIMNDIYQKEEYDLYQLIHEIEKINYKLKTEINFVEDLKEKLRKIKTNEIPKDLKEKIDLILKNT